ncbi:34865_t:CDS:1, partial [Gigaspora margarita]
MNRVNNVQPQNYQGQILPAIGGPQRTHNTVQRLPAIGGSQRTPNTVQRLPTIGGSQRTQNTVHLSISTSIAVQRYNDLVEGGNSFSGLQ